MGQIWQADGSSDPHEHAGHGEDHGHQDQEVVVSHRAHP